VELDEPAHQRQPDAEASFRVAPLALNEEVEDPRQDLRRHANARVLNPHHDLIALPAGAQRDVPTRSRVLDRVADEIGEHLLQSSGIRLDGERLLRQGELDREIACRGLEPTGLGHLLEG